MRGEKMLERMELVDPAYVEEADMENLTSRPRGKRWPLATGVAAAGLLLALMGGAYAGRKEEAKPPVSENLFPVSVPESISGGMGYESLLCRNISDLENGNPWTGIEKNARYPVYRNRAYDPSGAGIPIGLGEEAMEQRLEEAAKASKQNILSKEYVYDGEMEKDGTYLSKGPLIEITGETENGKIRVEADGDITYYLSQGEGIVLPDPLYFPVDETQREAGEEAAKEILDDLAEQCKELLGFSAPQAVSYGDFNIYGTFWRRFRCYDAGGDGLEDFLNYSFRCAEFIPDAEGRLYMIRMKDELLCAEKLGEYPIISEKEAVKRLEKGNYLTSVPLEFPGKSSIDKVELAYLSGPLTEILQPYYRFYVRIPVTSSDAQEAGLMEYGIYYVPALKEEYIENMPMYEGGQK